MSVESNAVVAECVKRFRRWRVPLHWALDDWKDEAIAHANAAACEALVDYDAMRGVSVTSFMRGRVMASLLTRYRQEWAQGSRWVAHSSHHGVHLHGVPVEGHEDLYEIGERRQRPRSAQPVLYEAEDLKRAMSHLGESDRWMLRQLFWEERSEAHIAQQLGISQPALNKRKQRALRELKSYLEK